MELVLGFVAGALVGWTFPQPAWVKTLIAAIKAKVAS